MVAYEYDPRDYPPRAVSVDIALFTILDDALQVLLIKRGVEPFLGATALPGGFVRDGEDLDQAAARELAEETGLRDGDWHLEQLAAYGAPDRDPRMRVVTVAYWAICAALPAVRGGGDAAAAVLTPVKRIEQGRVRLAFDHERIVRDAVERAQSRLDDPALAAKFCPPEFTIRQLRRVYEAVRNQRLDPGNFQRNVQRRGVLEKRAMAATTTRGRPASLWSVNASPFADRRPPAPEEQPASEPRGARGEPPLHRRRARAATEKAAATTRDGYLRIPSVAEFVEWLRPHVRGERPFHHEYRMRRPAGAWRCDSLWEAFSGYRWQGADFWKNQEQLDALALELRSTVEEHDRLGFVRAACDILRWGRVAAGNSQILKRLGGKALPAFREQNELLDPARADTARLSGIQYMNAGWTKVHALMLDGFPMYDGRVGAALGYLVRRYCLDAGLAKVPELLRFRWQAGEGGKGGPNRNPSRGSLRFPRLLHTNPPAWATSNVRAAWVLGAVCNEGEFGRLDERHRLRALEAALFMIGYEIAEDE